MAHQRRQARPVDMLPLLDIILVVLFVFATLEEGKTITNQEQIKKLKQELSAALQTLQTLRDAAPPTDSADPLAGLMTQIESLQAQNEELKQQQQASKADAKEIEEQMKQLLALKDNFENREYRLEHMARQDTLIKYLIKQVYITEVEIANSDNQCCYRQDPSKGQWLSCGRVPPGESFMEEWLKTGAGRQLSEILEATRGGNALTIITVSGIVGSIQEDLDSVLARLYKDKGQRFFFETKPATLKCQE